MRIKGVSNILSAKFWIHTVGITLLAILLCFAVDYLTAVSFLSPVDSGNEYVMPDMYCAVLNRRNTNQKTDIVIVASDGLTREQVGELIETIDSNAPSAIGVDLLFAVEQNKDSLLIERIENCSNIVMASLTKFDKETGTFCKEQGSYFEDDLLTPIFGIANLPISQASDVVREFRPFFVEDKDSVMSFATAVAYQANAPMVRNLQRRNQETEFIDYPSKLISVVDGHTVLEDSQVAATLAECIVLVGDTGNINDVFITPIDGNMPGVKIHAHAIHTIISGQYIGISTPLLNWTIGIIICLLFTICNIIAKQHMENIGNLFIRIVQIVTLFVLFWIGTKWFSLYHFYLNFYASMLLIGMGALAFDIWFGLYACYRVIRKDINKRRQQK